MKLWSNTRSILLIASDNLCNCRRRKRMKEHNMFSNDSKSQLGNRKCNDPCKFSI